MSTPPREPDPAAARGTPPAPAPHRRALLLPALAAASLLLALGVAAAFGAGAGRADEGGPSVHAVRAVAENRPFEDDDGRRWTLDRRLEIDGAGFYGTAFGPFVRLVDGEGRASEALSVVIESGERLVAWPPPGLRGDFTLVVENPDRRSATWPVSL